MLHKKENSCINYVEINITFIKQFFSLVKGIRVGIATKNYDLNNNFPDCS